MSRIRCYLKPGAWKDGDVRLDRDEEHHLRDVLRLEPGDKVAVFDGLGREALAEVHCGAEGRSHAFTIRLLESSNAPRPEPAFVLIQSLPKGRKMDLIIEKAVELGIAEILPVITERSIVRLDARQREDRQDRWQKLALSASRQCGARWIPDVRTPGTLKQALDLWGKGGLLMVGALGDGVPALHKVVDDWKGRKPGRIGIIIGPEGDLTSGEVRMAVDAGAIPVSFGSQVLRVETAAIFGMSVLTYEFGASGGE